MTDNKKHADDAVPKDKLGELIQKWRKQIRIDSNRETQAENRVYRDCADDLEELL